MELWVLLAIAAAFFQNLRSALQKTLTERVSVVGAAYARFLFAAPWAVLLVLILWRFLRLDLPQPGIDFFVWGAIGGLAQIGGTLLLLYLFGLRNFAVGNAFKKTETVQAALFGLVFLGDYLSPIAMAGILISLIGLLLLSGKRGLTGGVFNRAAGLGVLCGAAFAASGVSYRAANLSLGMEVDAIMRGAFTLAAVTVFQTIIGALYLACRHRGEMTRVVGQWKLAPSVGLAGMLASLCWFIAFGLATAAQVKAVGQVELLLSYATAVFMFSERPDRRETFGIGLVSIGIIVLILGS